MGSLFQHAAKFFQRARVSLLQALEAHPLAVVMAAMVTVGFGLIAGLNYWLGTPERIPMEILSLSSACLTLLLPMMLVWSHRRRQQIVIIKIRGLYAVAVEYLVTGRENEARRSLQSIRRWEQHWRIGNSALYRLAYSAFVIGATMLVACLYCVSAINADSQHHKIPHKNLIYTVDYLVKEPHSLWILGGVSLYFGVKAIEHLKDLTSAPWSEFYGDRLAAALKAGKTVNEAPWHDKAIPGESVSARELLGLPEHFTSAQLRRAWLNLVRELHPDRWTTAGDGVRRMKEEALKRVNAARDELTFQAVN